jgi:hypothetical protein
MAYWFENPTPKLLPPGLVDFHKRSYHHHQYPCHVHRVECLPGRSGRGAFHDGHPGQCCTKKRAFIATDEFSNKSAGKAASFSSRAASPWKYGLDVLPEAPWKWWPNAPRP